MMRPGDRTGDYIVERELGRGGMGVVYRVRHAVDGRPAAVKVLLPQLAKHVKPVRRFLREIDAVRAIVHPNVVRFLDAGLISIGHPFLVFELLDGVSLASLISAKRPVSVASVVEIVSQVANGLDAAHAAQVVHRDVSPANLFLARRPDGDATMKLIDFGVARLKDGVVGISSESLDLGSLIFRAPEQERDSASVGGAADIYALAVTTFAVLSGGLLPWGRGAAADVLERKALDPTPDVRRVFADLSEKQAQVFRVAMSCEPRERYSSATAFARELRQASGVNDAAPVRLDALLAS
jgi:serine/threonine-protein kinase